MPEERPETDLDLIVRMDERVKQAVTIMEQRDIYHRAEMERHTKMHLDSIAAFTGALTGMQAGYMQTITAMQAGFASKSDLQTTNNNVSRLERTVYGACAVVLLGFIGALVAMVWRTGA